MCSKTRFKLIMDIAVRTTNAALERGEVAAIRPPWCAQSRASDWNQVQEVSFLVQYSLTRHPELPDVPTAVKLDAARKNAPFKCLMCRRRSVQPFFTTPGVPADRLVALRRAFDATMRAPNFLADVTRSTLSVGPMTGEDLQKLIAQVSNLRRTFWKKFGSPI